MSIFRALTDRRAKEEERIAQYDAAYHSIENFYVWMRHKQLASSLVSFKSKIDSSLTVEFVIEKGGDGYYLTLEKIRGKSLPGIGGVCGDIEKINYNIPKDFRDAYVQLERHESEDDAVFSPNNEPEVFWKEIETLSGPTKTTLGLLEK